jgi:seryl-tRNA synthetase
MTDKNWPAWSWPQLLEKMPPVARRKFARLEAELADAEAMQGATHARMDKLQRDCDRIRQQLSACDPTDTEQIAELKEELRDLHEQLSELDRERSRRDGVRSNCAQVIAQVKEVFAPKVWGGFEQHAYHVPAHVSSSAPRRRHRAGDTARAWRNFTRVARAGGRPPCTADA